MLTGIDILLTYQCTGECDHCFLHCGPRSKGTFTLRQLRELLLEIGKIGTIGTVYFEGGEPFLFYAVLLAGMRRGTRRGYAIWHRDQRILGDLGGGCGAMVATDARLECGRLQRK